MRIRCPAVFLAVILLSSLVLGGCSGLLFGKETPIDLYDLSPGRLDLPTGPSLGVVVVEEPLASGGLDDHRIATRPSPLRLQPMAGARWSERAPEMVQTLLVELFETSGRVTAVGRGGAGARDLILESELRAFEAEYFDGATRPDIRVRLAVRLVIPPRREMVAMRVFEHVVPANGEDRTAVLQAFDAAAHAVGEEVARWAFEVAPPLEKANDENS